MEMKSSLKIFGLVVLTVFAVSLVLAVNHGAAIGISLTLNSSAATLYNGTVGEDVAWMINLSLNNTNDASTNDANITRVNITLPTGFAYTTGSANVSSENTAIINNGNFTATGSVLEWTNDSSVYAVAAISDANNASTFFSFVVTAANPGAFNMTVRWMNATTMETENITIIINDTAAPEISWTSQTYGNYTNQSKYGIVANISVDDDWASELNIWGGLWRNGSINITLLSTALVPLNSTFSTFFTNDTTSLHINFTNTTGLAEGVYYINATVNDSENNINWTLRKIYIDRTAPTATFSCTPTADLNVGEAVVCTCTATNDTALLAVAETSGFVSSVFNATGDTSYAGDVTESCTLLDRAGNSRTYAVSYEVFTSDAAGTGSGGGSSTISKTVVVTDEEFKEGKQTSLKANERARVKVASMNHYVTVDSVSTSTAKITVSSDPQEATLNVGDTRKFDVDADDVYDISVTLDSITSGKADLTVKSISEAVTAESEAEQEAAESAAATPEDTGDEESQASNWWVWMVIIIVVLVIAGVIYWKKK